MGNYVYMVWVQPHGYNNITSKMHDLKLCAYRLIFSTTVQTYYTVVVKYGSVQGCSIVGCGNTWSPFNVHFWYEHAAFCFVSCCHRTNYALVWILFWHCKVLLPREYFYLRNGVSYIAGETATVRSENVMSVNRLQICTACVAMWTNIRLSTVYAWGIHVQ